MNKATAFKAAGAGVSILLLFYMIQDMRVELNEIRERLAVLETTIGVKK